MVQRRKVYQALLPALAAPGIWAAASAPAAAELNSFIAGVRKQKTEDAKVRSIFNPDYYKKDLGNYNTDNLQDFFPTLFLVRRQFEAISDYLDNPPRGANLSDPVIYEILREQNRIAPTGQVRKEALRTKNWCKLNKVNAGKADLEYERLKRSLEDEDTHLLVCSRTSAVELGALRVTKRYVQDVLDSLDNFIGLLPEEEQNAGKTIAELRDLPPLAVLDLEELKKKKNRFRTKMERAEEEKNAKAAEAELKRESELFAQDGKLSSPISGEKKDAATALTTEEAPPAVSMLAPEEPAADFAL